MDMVGQVWVGCACQVSDKSHVFLDIDESAKLNSHVG